MDDFDKTMKDIKEHLIDRIKRQEKEIERLTTELDKTRLSELDKEYKINKAIEYIEKGLYSDYGERATRAGEELLEILKGSDSNDK